MPIPQIDFQKYIPGFNGLTSAASGNIGAQLSGLPSTGRAKTKAAYFGATSGMPNSGVSNALGYSLYGQEAEQQQQQGFENLIAMLTGYSGTVAPTTGQQLQSSISDRDFQDNRRREDLGRQDAEYAQSRLNRPKRYGFKMAGNRGPVPGGFQDREWWA